MPIGADPLFGGKLPSCGQIESAKNSHRQQLFCRRDLPSDPAKVGSLSTKELRKGGSAMLVLSRKVGEQILIGSDVCVTVVSIKGNRITLGVDAPRSVRVDRAELAAREVPDEPVAVPAATFVEDLPAESLAACVAGFGI